LTPFIMMNPMKKGQMVLMPLWSSNRDGRVFPNVEHGWQLGLAALPLRWNRQR
jgi:hypothetical protein